METPEQNTPEQTQPEQTPPENIDPIEQANMNHPLGPENTHDDVPATPAPIENTQPLNNTPMADEKETKPEPKKETAPKKEKKEETAPVTIKKDYTLLIGAIIALLAAAAIVYLQIMRKRKEDDNTIDQEYADDQNAGYDDQYRRY